jgi:hypothetical protein
MPNGKQMAGNGSFHLMAQTVFLEDPDCPTLAAKQNNKK